MDQQLMCTLQVSVAAGFDPNPGGIVSWHVDASFLKVPARPCRRDMHETGGVSCHERWPGGIAVNR